ncbi:hypothetical protein JKI95_06295 [Corynebacterium aquatimens]|uniref:hypothetical protein n=1 Tax=Corynebacterium TaxID=1716 RepID=UPI001F1FCB20|nr:MULTISPECIES: hypothetical protein [Corynebacterium]QYH18947.1 hypothetical protein JKI95_06295 [Corynebacterium aquatimens]UIZ92223.1 hypothetical protein JZY91_11400 [Corynebacterium sp. CNCTC7651]
MKHLEDGMYLEIGHQLLSGTTQFHPDALEPINDRFWMFKSDCPNLDLTYASARANPGRVRYTTPAAQRAAAHIMTEPSYVLTGFGALALYGLRYLTDGTDTVLMGSKVVRKQAPTTTMPAKVRGSMRPDEVWNVRCGDISVQVAAPHVALVQALRLVKRGDAKWSVIKVPGADPEFVRAVQLVDACRRFLRVQPMDILKAGHNRVDERWLTKVVRASSYQADSPKETEMRFLATRFAAKHGFTLVEQLPIYRDGKIVTTFDLALLEPRIGLMYDGGHHDEREQLVKDDMINIDLAAEKWTPARFRNETLPLFEQKLEGLL